MNYVKNSLSFNLKIAKITLLDMLVHTKSRYVQIQTVCYLKSLTNCNGNLKGLCGSVEIAINKLMNCVWELKVPEKLCINVTIDKFLSGEPFVDDYFLLSIMDKKKPNSSAGIHFHVNQLATDVITNSSQSLINLQIKKLFVVSRFSLDFQAADCNSTVS